MYENLTGLLTQTPNVGALIGVFLVIFLVIFLFGIAAYIYMGLALMRLAERLEVENSWLAWVPIGNLYLISTMAKMPWWPMLFLIGAFIPYIGFFFSIAFGVFSTIWIWKICEFRNRPGWWALLTYIPLFGAVWAFVLWGKLAWSKD